MRRGSARRRLRGGEYGCIKIDARRRSPASTLRDPRGGEAVHSRYVGTLSRGPRTLGWQVPRKAGTYTVTLTARDLAGNTGERRRATSRCSSRVKKKRRG